MADLTVGEHIEAVRAAIKAHPAEVLHVLGRVAGPWSPGFYKNAFRYHAVTGESVAAVRMERLEVDHPEGRLIKQIWTMSLAGLTAGRGKRFDSEDDARAEVDEYLKGDGWTLMEVSRG